MGVGWGTQGDKTRFGVGVEKGWREGEGEGRDGVWWLEGNGGGKGRGWGGRRGAMLGIGNNAYYRPTEQ